MKLRIFQADAFASSLFKGNPAAIVPLEEWLPDELMQQIAMENNLSETAFFVKEQDDYHIRWFTPTMEVALCGHATLATAHILMNELGFAEDRVLFSSKSGQLAVNKSDNLLELDFPVQAPEKSELPEGLTDGFQFTPVESLKAHEDYLLIFESEQQVAELSPDFGLLARIPARGIICSAPGKEVDFVSRFFAPAAGINEDPVTGSAHTKLIPYWAEKLGKTRLSAKQISQRGGELFCSLKGDRVTIAGEAVTYLDGWIYL